MAGTINPIVGRPGITSGPNANYFTIFGQPELVKYLPGGGEIASISQDYLNTSNSYCLRPGLMLGVASTGGNTGQYLPSVIDVTQGALANSGTSITLTAAGAAGLVNRVGSSGTLALTGGSVANGTARTVAVTYSAVNTTTGVVTITSPTVSQVVTLDFTNSPSGTFQLSIQDFNGIVQRTAPITYSGTAATLVSNMQTAINAVIPQVASVNQIVVSGSAVTAILLTYSGVNYAGLTFPAIGVDTGGLSAGNVSSQITTNAINGAFIAGSFVGANDGSAIPNTVIPDGSGLLTGPNVVGGGIDFPWIAYSALVNATSLLPYWPSDKGLQAFIQNSFNSAPGNYGWSFSNTFTNIT